MAIPLTYIARNLWARRLTTALTAGGLALVVFVFATMLMLDAGLKKTLVTTGEHDNVVVIRKGAETEIQSAVERGQASILEMHPAVAMTGAGQPMASREAALSARRSRPVRAATRSRLGRLNSVRCSVSTWPEGRLSTAMPLSTWPRIASASAWMRALDRYWFGRLYT